MKYSRTKLAAPSFSYAIRCPQEYREKTSTADNPVDPQLHRLSNFLLTIAPFALACEWRYFGGDRWSGDQCDSQIFNSHAESSAWRSWAEGERKIHQVKTMGSKKSMNRWSIRARMGFNSRIHYVFLIRRSNIRIGFIPLLARRSQCTFSIH